MANQAERLLSEQFRTKWSEEIKKMGRVNLAIFGKTGVGKSTLVNAIFGRDVAPTGIGRPITRDNTLYVHEEGFLGIVDTRGLEVGVDSKRILDGLEDYIKASHKLPLADQIHLAWYCVRAPDRRFEDVEADFVRGLHRLGLPVILVLTQVPVRNGRPHPDALALAREIEARGLPIESGRVILTMARADDFDGLEQHGLQELLDASFRCVPEPVTAALAAAQKIDPRRKHEQAEVAIRAAAAAAAGIGASPIPFSDAVLLVPAQLAMMARISALYGIELEKATMASLAATAAATTAGRTAVTNLIKLVPGVGTVAGGMISAGVASTFTLAMGYAWVAVCEQLADGRLEGVGHALDSDAIRTLFLRELKRRLGRRG